MRKQLTEEQKEKVRKRAIEWNNSHKERVEQNARLYRSRHQEEINKRLREYVKASPEPNKRRQEEWNLKYPWYKSWVAARQRCNNVKCQAYNYYGDRGIKCLLSKADISFLWIRDNAKDLDVPNLDRLDSDKDYNLDNCRFISKSDNSKKAYIEKINRKNSRNDLVFNNSKKMNELYPNLHTMSAE